MSSIPQKRILLLSPYYPPHLGGLEEYTHDLAFALSRFPLTLQIVTSNLPPMKNAAPGQKNILRLPSWEIIYNYPLPNIFSLTFWQFLAETHKHPPACIISFTRFFYTSLLALIISKCYRIPWIHVEHGSDFVSSKNILIKYAARFYDIFIGSLIFKTATLNIAPSKSAASFINRFDSRPSTVIYRGLSPNLNRLSSDKSLVRKQFPHALLLTYAGRFISGKGLPDLLRAFSSISIPSVKLLLVGSGNDLNELQTLAKTLPRAQDIIFLGPKPHQTTLQIIRYSDIIINPSYNEGLPTSVLEAAALGKAILATDAGGTKEIIQDNVSGLLYPPGNLHSLIQSLEKLCSEPDLRRRLGNEAAKAVFHQFSWPKTAQAYYNLITSLSP